MLKRTNPETYGDCVIRVDHAGENGAVNIYRGQLLISRWLHRGLVSELTEFRQHEERHRALFAEELRRRGRRRCRSYHLCGLGGLVLGLITGMCGRSAIAATTYAVERVVLRHLDHQLTDLSSSDPAAADCVKAIIEDEQQHHDAAAASLSSRFWQRVLVPVVSASTEAVIWSGMRL